MDKFASDIQRIISQLPKLPKHVAVTAADQFDQNWQRQGFFNDRWKPSQRVQRGGGSTLLKTGDLRRSLRYRVEGGRIVFYSDRPDAVIHNEGGTVQPTVTPKMRRFAWAMYKKTGDSKFKALALTQKAKLSISIPKRQFVGDHPMLDKAVERTVDNFILKLMR